MMNGVTKKLLCRCRLNLRLLDRRPKEQLELRAGGKSSEDELAIITSGGFSCPLPQRAVWRQKISSANCIEAACRYERCCL